MAVLQHAPAGYLLSLPLTELQITIKESCLSFLLASRKTYSGSFTLIFIHLVIDKCEAVQSSLPPPGLSPGTLAPFAPQGRARLQGGVQGARPHERRVWVKDVLPLSAEIWKVAVPREVLLIYLYFILFYF